MQFFAHTFVTYIVGLDAPWMGVIRSWKEIFVVIGALVACRIVRKDRPRTDREDASTGHSHNTSSKIVRYMTLVRIALMIYALADTLLR